MPFVNAEERIRQLCAMIAAETSPIELRSLLRQLEFVLTEYNLEYKTALFTLPTLR